jgi:O-antigen/teichoic acid export membrane protein
LGILKEQAYSNTINIVIGFIAGAINTIIVLPRAFESSLDDWGLVKLVLSFSLILAPIFGFGSNNIIIKEYGSHNSTTHNQGILGFSLLLGLIGSLLLALFVLSNGLNLFINSRDAAALSENSFSLILLSISLTFGQVFSGFIIAKHKTPFIQFVNETFLKVSYLCISLIYLFSPFSFELFLKLYVSTYTISLLIYIIYAFNLGFNPSFKFKLLQIREIIIYGFYTVLDKGAAIIVGNLDLIMIAFLLNLTDVAIYGLAFYIAAVILIPQKALLTPSYPLVSTAVKNNNIDDLNKLYRQSSLNQLIIGGSLFVLIWSSIDQIFALIPSEFYEGKWVVFYIGLSRLFILLGGVSGAIIVFSKYYRINLVFNLFLIGLTILSNYILIPYYEMTGAAMATAITFFAYNLIKIAYIQNVFKINPFNSETFKSILILMILLVAGSYLDLYISHPIISILSHSLVLAFLMVLLFYGLKVKAEILDIPLKVWKRFVNR